MKSHLKVILQFYLFIFIVNVQSFSQSKTSAGFPVNYDENLVGEYTLPDVLTCTDGQKVTDIQIWESKRRPEILDMIEQIQFGRCPEKPADLSFKTFETDTAALNGTAIRKQVTLYFTKDTSTHKADVLIYLPKSDKPVPLILFISFTANCISVNDTGIKEGYVWTRKGEKIPGSQGRSFGKLDVEKFITQGIGIARVYYGDIEPDFKKGFQYGIRGYYLKEMQDYPADNEWGAIAAWSWGLSRIMDYFETDKDIDENRIALQGTSRLGKTVLWTGARDPRFRMIIASCSGEGGAAISRRDYGENIKHITDTSRYFYQFAPNYHKYAFKVDSLPFDAHMLVALIAPRSLLLQTGSTDVWSDPKGEFLSAIAAKPVYKLYGKQGPGIDSLPQAGDASYLDTLGYYMHDGGHGLVDSDWDIFITYIKKFL